MNPFCLVSDDHLNEDNHSGDGSGSDSDLHFSAGDFQRGFCNLNRNGRYAQILIILIVICVTFPITTGVFGLTIGLQLAALHRKQ